MANLTCLAAARHRLLDHVGSSVEQRGLYHASPLRMVASAEGPVTVHKALSLLGIGTDAIMSVPCDADGGMRADALPTL